MLSFTDMTFLQPVEVRYFPIKILNEKIDLPFTSKILTIKNCVLRLLIKSRPI